MNDDYKKKNKPQRTNTRDNYRIYSSIRSLLLLISLCLYTFHQYLYRFHRLIAVSRTSDDYIHMCSIYAFAAWLCKIIIIIIFFISDNNLKYTRRFSGEWNEIHLPSDHLWLPIMWWLVRFMQHTFTRVKSYINICEGIQHNK